MRKLIFILLLLIVVAIGVVAALLWFGGGTLEETTLAREEKLREMIALAPAGERELFAIPSVAPLHRALASSDVTERGIADFPQSRDVAIFSRLLGSSPAVAWSSSGHLAMIARPAPWRAAILGTAAKLSGASTPVTRYGEFLVVGDLAPSESPADIPAELQTAAGHMFVIHRGKNSNRYPPVPRPAVSSVIVKDASIRVVSAALAGSGETPAQLVTAFSPPADALASGILSSSADIVRDLDRFLPFDLGRLAQRGAMLVIYDVKSGGLLPQPRGLLALPETPESLDAVSSLFNVVTLGSTESSGVQSRTIDRLQIDRVERLGATIEAARYGGQILLGFDEKSIERYVTAQKVDPKTESFVWTFDADAVRLRPLVADLADDKALSFAAKRVSRAARQLDAVLRLLSGGERISAVKRREGPLEIVEMTISSTK